MEETERPEGRGAAKEKEEKGAELFYMLQSLVIAVSAMILLFTFVVRVNQVKGHSMDNTLQPQELLLVWHLGYTPKAGDIVIVNRPNVDILEGEAIVKRVIAVGGQTVDIDYGAGIVYVDGVPLDEPYIKETMYLPGSPYMQQTHFDIPEGSVFVMGDNRNNSTDSRNEAVGPVEERFILGHAVLGLWPLSKLGAL